VSDEAAAVVVQAVCFVLGAGLGAVLRAAVLARVAVARPPLRALGTAWVNVPASYVAALALAWLATATGAEPLLAERVTVGGLGPSLLLGVCGGLSTWSSLALEVAAALRADDRAALRASGLGVLAGVAAGVAGVGTVVTLGLFLP
jgi:fluoride ion exporter CrcB/FEX